MNMQLIYGTTQPNNIEGHKLAAKYHLPIAYRKDANLKCDHMCTTCFTCAKKTHVKCVFFLTLCVNPI